MNLRRLGAMLSTSAVLLISAGCSGDDGAKDSGDTATTSLPADASVTTAVDGSPSSTPSATTDGSGTEVPTTDPGTTDPGTTDQTDTSFVLDDPPPDPDPDETQPPAQLALPGDGEATVDGVELPAGHLLLDGDQRLAWITDDIVTDAAAVWMQLHEAYPQTGLYPVLVYDDGSPAGWEVEAFFANQPLSIDQYDLEDVFIRSAESNFDPPRTFNGLAPASSGPADLDAADALISAMDDARILLVESPRGADSLSYMGWTGDSWDATEALVVAVRSWEERYGAWVVAVGPTRLTLAIARPPATADEAAALSEELILLDPELETGQAPEELEVVELGDGLLGQHMWTLWWA